MIYAFIVAMFLCTLGYVLYLFAYPYLLSSLRYSPIIEFMPKVECVFPEEGTRVLFYVEAYPLDGKCKKFYIVTNNMMTAETIIDDIGKYSYVTIRYVD